MNWWRVIKSLILARKAVTVASKNQSQQQVGKEIYNYPSLSLSFDLVRDLVNAQPGRLNALDTKANFALTAATGLVSAGLVLQSLLLPHSHAACLSILPPLLTTFLHNLPLLLKRGIPLLPLLASYLVVMIIGWRAYKTFKLGEVPSPRDITKYLPEPDYYTKAVVFRTLIQVYENNSAKLARKASLIDWAFLFLIIEAGMLVFLLIYQGIC